MRSTKEEIPKNDIEVPKKDIDDIVAVPEIKDLKSQEIPNNIGTFDKDIYGE